MSFLAETPADAARRSGLTTEQALSDAGMTGSLRRLTPFFIEAKATFARYGLPLDTTFADLRTGLSVTGGPRSGDAAFLRFQLALALAANPRSRAEGITHLRYGFNGSAVHLLPLTFLALGRTYEAAEKPDSAAIAYGRFLRLWDKADPELQGRVSEAKEALARLAAEPR